MIDLISLADIKDILQNSSTIAIGGLSSKPSRPSNQVAEYLIAACFTVIPVNPGQDSILGLKCYPDLLSIPDKVDVVDIFRRPEDVGGIVDQAIAIDARVVWMQLGIVNETAAERARKHGIKVIMDRCIKVDHAGLFR